MCSSPDGYGSISSTYAFSASRRVRVVRVRRHEGAGLVPDLLPLALDCVRVVAVHFASLDTKKPLVSRGRGKPTRRAPRSLPCLRKAGVSRALSVARSRVAAGPIQRPSSPHAPTCPRGAPRAPAFTLPRNRCHVSVPELRRSCLVHRQNRRVLELFPDTARIDGGALSLGGIAAADLVARAREPARRLRRGDAPRRAPAPTARPRRDAVVVYGTKAFPNVALLRLLAEEGIGADVSTLGELRFAQAAGIAGDRLVVHGNNKSRRGARARPPRPARSSSSTRSRRSTGRARPASRGRSSASRPGIEADTHETIRTGHHGSKFGLTPDDALEALRRDARDRGAPRARRLAAPRRRRAALTAVDWIAAFAARARDELGWSCARSTSAAASASPTTPDEPRARRSPSSSRTPARRARARLRAAGLPLPQRDPRARPLARRPRRRDALHRRLGQALAATRRPTSRSTAACPTTPAPPSTAPATRRSSPTAPTSRRPAPTRSPASTASRATC